MIRNTKDRSERSPWLRIHLNLMLQEDLCAEHFGLAGADADPLLAAIAEAGYEGVQFVESATPAQLAACARLGMGKCGSGRVNAVNRLC